MDFEDRSYDPEGAAKQKRCLETARVVSLAVQSAREELNRAASQYPGIAMSDFEIVPALKTAVRKLDEARMWIAVARGEFKV